MVNDVEFSWKDMETIFTKDVQRYTNNLSVRIDIVKHAIHLDK